MNRWKEVENSQLFLKQNLVRYNNFVREKQAKVADGISFILMERQKQTKVGLGVSFKDMNENDFSAEQNMHIA